MIKHDVPTSAGVCVQITHTPADVACHTTCMPGRSICLDRLRENLSLALSVKGARILAKGAGMFTLKPRGLFLS